MAILDFYYYIYKSSNDLKAPVIHQGYTTHVCKPPIESLLTRDSIDVICITRRRSYAHPYCLPPTTRRVTYSLKFRGDRACPEIVLEV